MDRQMDGRTDGLTKRGVESRSTRLKKGKRKEQPKIDLKFVLFSTFKCFFFRFLVWRIGNVKVM